MPEKVVQPQGCNLLRSIGARVWELGTRRPRTDLYQGTRQTPGLPDVFAILPAPRHGFGYGSPDGCSLWWEAKAEGGRLSSEQEKFRDACLEVGQPYVSGGLDELIAWLVEGGWLTRENLAHYRRPAEVTRCD